MPDKKTIERAAEDKREGKSPSTQAGEFVRQEIEHIRAGKHGARSAKQAIAIGLSEARRAGVDIPPPPNAAPSKSKRSPKAKVSRKRSQAALKALRHESTSTVSHDALSRQAKSAARKRKTAK